MRHFNLNKLPFMVRLVAGSLFMTFLMLGLPPGCEWITNPKATPALFSTDPQVTPSMRFSSADDLFGKTLDTLTTYRTAGLISDETQAKIDKAREEGYKIILSLRKLQDAKLDGSQEFTDKLETLKLIVGELIGIRDTTNPHAKTASTEVVVIGQIAYATLVALINMQKWTMNKVEERRKEGKDLQPEDIEFIRNNTDLAVIHNRAVGVTNPPAPTDNG